VSGAGRGSPACYYDRGDRWACFDRLCDVECEHVGKYFIASVPVELLLYVDPPCFKRDRQLGNDCGKDRNQKIYVICRASPSFKGKQPTDPLEIDAEVTSLRPDILSLYHRGADPSQADKSVSLRLGLAPPYKKKQSDGVVRPFGPGHLDDDWVGFVAHPSKDYQFANVHVRANIRQGLGARPSLSLDASAAVTVPPSAATGRVVLYLGSQPRGVEPLKLDDEIARIHAELGGQAEAAYQLEPILDYPVADLQVLLAAHRPEILHFSNHGDSRSGALYLRDRQGGLAEFRPDQLRRIFEVPELRPKLKCVVLISCYSEPQANIIKDYVPYIVYTRRRVADRAALAFATGFYGCLARKGASIEVAFRMGRAQVSSEDAPDADAFDILRTSDGLTWQILASGAS
jgi:hypothetical protein